MEIGTKTPWECQLCFESYDETDRRPRALPCGHPFCSPCITNMIKNDQLTCPYCRATHRATSYTDFPISYGMEEFIRSLKSPSIATKPVQDPSGVIGKNLQALMLEQENYMKKSRELICQNLLKQMDLYDAELVNSQKDHEQLVTRLNSLVEQNKFATQLLQRQRNIIQIKKTAFENLKKKQSTIQTCMSSASTTQEALSAVEDQLGCSTEMKNWIRNCQEDFPDVEAIHISMKVREVTRMTLDNVIIKDNSMVAIPTHLITLIRTQEKSSTIMDRVKLITFSVSVVNVVGV
ncbi:E3 ubiquitin-protein ligase NHLRC1-like 1 [Homarus americanus]|uniref:E3 ubiquitin-protein ligase NHLRC1-like 1 n=1 Tax=Homarus americanus TaxID=6706 RepID=A0A8J5JTE8_HOMAM|nr:E3 ubiquitin-protein ligase NHLRC1-like 1 [Homarus americanus]